MPETTKNPPPPPFSWGRFTPEFLDALALRLAGRRVLEVFAGNGLLAAGLAERGVDVLATTLLSGHDGHEQGMHHPVTEMDAFEAVATLGDGYDVLLMSWPTTTEAATAAVLQWGGDRDILFVGEITDHATGFLGGCATDLFFKVTEVSGALDGYEGRGRHDRAVVMRTQPDCARRWGDGVRTRAGLLSDEPSPSGYR